MKYFFAIFMISLSALGATFVDRTTDPILSMDQVEVVADLAYPPGNIAVATTGRIFFTFFPMAKPPFNLAELVNGVPVPFPSVEAQKEFSTILSVRIDRQNRLWAVDYGNLGLHHPKLLAFDLTSGEKVYEYIFKCGEAGFLSMLNDFQIDPEGRFAYIADNSPIWGHQSILVLDLTKKTTLKRLKNHESVSAGDYTTHVHGKPMHLSKRFGGIDPIALSRDGKTLYFAPFNGNWMYRISAEKLRDEKLTDDDLESSLEKFALKTMSDGMTIDNEGNLYLSDVEHSAVVQLRQDGQLVTLLKDKKIRWPDGFSFAPEGWLYFTNSAISEILLKSKKTVQKLGPYQIMRFKPGPEGLPGH